MAKEYSIPSSDYNHRFEKAEPNFAEALESVEEHAAKAVLNFRKDLYVSGFMAGYRFALQTLTEGGDKEARWKSWKQRPFLNHILVRRQGVLAKFHLKFHLLSTLTFDELLSESIGYINDLYSATTVEEAEYCAVHAGERVFTACYKRLTDILGYDRDYL